MLFGTVIGNLKTLKHTFSEKYQFFVLFTVSVRMKMTEYLKKKNKLRY